MRTNCAWGFFLARSQETKGKLLMDNSTATQTHQQRTITIFFSPITPTHATSQSRAKEMGSRPGHCKGVPIDQEIRFFHARRSVPCGPQFYHPCHCQTKATISHHHRCVPHYGDLPILDWTMLEIFQRQKLEYIWFGNLTCIDDSLVTF